MLKQHNARPFLSYRLPRILLFALWFGLYFYLCLCHEPFRDEAQSFMIAKHNTVPGIMNFCWEEGHPWLWHLFLYPFAHLGFPYAGVKWLGFALTACGMGVYMQKSPFPLPVTALTAFLEYSYYGVFGRCYSLMFLLCMLTAASWKHRLKKPWLTALCLGLLASVHLMTWPLCCALACVHISGLFREKGSKWRFLSLPAGLAPAALFCLPLWPQIEKTFAKFGWNPIVFFVLLFLFAVGAVALLALMPSVFGRNPVLLSYMTAAFYMLLPVIVAVSTYFVLIKATSSTIAAETNLLHLCEIVPLLLCVAWVCAQRRGELTAAKKALMPEGEAMDKPAPEDPAWAEATHKASPAAPWESARVTSLVLILVLLWTFYLNTGDNALHKKIWMDTKSYYSGSEPLAEYIRENVPKDAVIVATRRGTNTSVAAYLDGDYTLTCLLSHEPLYYTKWCSDWPHPIPRSEWLPDLMSLMEEHGEIYVIYSDDTEVDYFSAWLWRLIDEGDAEMVYHSNAYGEALTDVPDDFKPIERCETMGLYKITAID